MHVKVIMRSPVSVVDVDAAVEEAAALMSRDAVRHLPVKEGASVVGLVSERDLRRVQPSTLPPLDTWEMSPAPGRLRVRDVMSALPPSVGPDASVTEAASLLAAHRMEVLPVLDGREPVGLVGIRDLLGVLRRDAERPRRARVEHILAAVDDHQTHVPRAAIALARHHDARLTLVWVLAPLPRQQLTEISPVSWAEVARQRRNHARTWLASRLSGETAAGWAPDLIVAEGRLTEEVIALAGRREADLVVVDARIAEPLVVEAPCPVLGIPPAREARHAR
jgi:CBS domain-containing protein